MCEAVASTATTAKPAIGISRTTSNQGFTTVIGSTHPKGLSQTLSIPVTKLRASGSPPTPIKAGSHVLSGSKTTAPTHAKLGKSSTSGEPAKKVLSPVRDPHVNVVEVDLVVRKSLLLGVKQ
jgi:hypothetical protein